MIPQITKKITIRQKLIIIYSNYCCPNPTQSSRPNPAGLIILTKLSNGLNWLQGD